MPAAVHVAPGTFFAIIAVSAIAGTLSAVAAERHLVLPAVVLELLLGVLIGPQVLGLQVTSFISFIASLGLGMLFFFAGYEIDLRRIRGEPCGRARGLGALARARIGIGGVLGGRGRALAALHGLGARDDRDRDADPDPLRRGELRTRFGTYVLAAGAMGEFGPILLLTLILSTQSTLHNALILVAFIALAVAAALFAVRSSERALPLLERTLERSTQLAVRWT